MKRKLPIIVCAVALIFTSWSASAKQTGGSIDRDLENLAVESKALDLQIMAPRTGTHITLRKPLTRTNTLVCGVLRPRSNPAIDVYFTAVVEVAEVINFEVDSDESGKVSKFCRKIDMSMP